MSRTSKFMASSVALLLGTTALHAQSASNPDDAAERMVRQSLEAGGDAPSLREKIRERLDTLLSEIDESPITRQDDDSLTIEDIDQLNRAAERERTELEFEQARFERMQLDLERLMALHEVVRTLEEEDAERMASRPAPVEESRQESSAPVQVDNSQANFMSEQSLLPRVSAIVGVGGAYTAKISADDGTMREVGVGDEVSNGFTIDEITPGAAFLTGSITGVRYRLTPSQAATPQPQARQQGAVTDAIDLSQFPMAQF